MLLAVHHELAGEGMAKYLGQLPLGEIYASLLASRMKSLAGLGKQLADLSTPAGGDRERPVHNDESVPGGYNLR